MNDTGISGWFAAAIVASFLGVTVGRADDRVVWQPQKTRVFIVSLARFKSERLRSFSTDDRLDDRFAQLFRERGVPANQIVLLKDEEATTQNVQHEFVNLLHQSGPDETLLFYFGSHGALDRKTGDYSFCAFNENLSFAWVFDAIERDFRGTRAILLADCCYSGGIIELASKRKTSIAYACLSSTFSQQIAHSGWRFMQCLMRGFAGNPVVDLNGDGQIELEELAMYTARYMAFAAEGMPMFKVTGQFNPKLELSKAGTRGPRDGELLEVLSNAMWRKAEVLEANDQRLKVHFTQDTRVSNDAWFSIDRVRPFRFEKYATGSAVEVRSSSDGVWHSAKVLQNWESLHLCRYDDYSSAYDEWFGHSRVRKSVAGSWSGRWKNSLGESGPETLELMLNKDQKLEGTWSGDVALKGERIGYDTIYLEGTTPDRFYRCAGRTDGARLLLNYVADRRPGDGHYYGWAELGQQGEELSANRDPRAEFSGKWTGTYENSKGGSGTELLVITENSNKLHGMWSGIEVNGERLGNSMFLLEGASGNRRFRAIGHMAHGLVLNYSATLGNEHYTGRSLLNR